MSEPQGYTQAVVDILNSKLGQSITQAFTAGEEQVRERIIKLLEERITGCTGYDCERCGEVEGLSAAIDLIEGEQK